MVEQQVWQVHSLPTPIIPGIHKFDVILWIDARPSRMFSALHHALGCTCSDSQPRWIFLWRSNNCPGQSNEADTSDFT